MNRAEYLYEDLKERTKDCDVSDGIVTGIATNHICLSDNVEEVIKVFNEHNVNVVYFTGGSSDLITVMNKFFKSGYVNIGTIEINNSFGATYTALSLSKDVKE